MPLTVQLVVGGDSFKAEGDFTIESVVPAIKEWGRLIGLAPQQEDIDSITEQLKTNNDALQTVITNTPKES